MEETIQELAEWAPPEWEEVPDLFCVRCTAPVLEEQQLRDLPIINFGCSCGARAETWVREKGLEYPRYRLREKMAADSSTISSSEGFDYVRYVAVAHCPQCRGRLKSFFGIFAIEGPPEGMADPRVCVEPSEKGLHKLPFCCVDCQLTFYVIFMQTLFPNPYENVL
jgi:hypothetical protein